MIPDFVSTGYAATSFARLSSQSALSYEAFAPRMRRWSRRTVSMLWLKTSGRAPSTT